MPTSATGTSRADAGFTLVEALTTLVVISLMAGAVILLLPGPDRETRAFAERFAQRMALASEEAIILNKPVALVMNGEGYGFARLEADGWQDVARASPLAFRRWPDNLSASLESGETEVGEEGRAVRFDPMGAATPARILINGSGARWRVDVDGQGRPHVARAQ